MKTSTGIDFVRSCVSIRFAGAVAVLALSCHPESGPSTTPPTSVVSPPVSDRPFGRYERARTSPAKPLSAEQRAEARALEGGNTLITESIRGRAFEVTQEGEIVWEFRSPFRASPKREFVAFIPDMQRMPAGFGGDWLEH